MGETVVGAGIEPQVGIRVTFGIEIDRLGRPRATNIVAER
jgi:hypothetical protein